MYLTLVWKSGFKCICWQTFIYYNLKGPEYFANIRRENLKDMKKKKKEKHLDCSIKRGEEMRVKKWKRGEK